MRGNTGPWSACPCSGDQVHEGKCSMNRQPREPPVRRAWLGAWAGALAASAAPIGAQDPDPEIRGTSSVDVTGSHIRRMESEGALPLQIITRDEMINGGIRRRRSCSSA